MPGTLSKNHVYRLWQLRAVSMWMLDFVLTIWNYGGLCFGGQQKHIFMVIPESHFLIKTGSVSIESHGLLMLWLDHVWALCSFIPRRPPSSVFDHFQHAKYRWEISPHSLTSGASHRQVHRCLMKKLKAFSCNICQSYSSFFEQLPPQVYHFQYANRDSCGHSSVHVKRLYC